jgi:hypothetical protein
MATYIVRAGENGPVKIGWADDVPSRLATLQTGHYETLTVIREVDTWWQSEAEFHRRFASHRLRGEWFTFVPEMLSFVPTAPKPRTLSSNLPGSLVAREEAKRLIDAILARRGVGVPLADALRHVATATEFTPRRVKAIYHMEARLIAEHEMKTLRRLAAGEEGLRTGAGAASGSAEGE